MLPLSIYSAALACLAREEEERAGLGGRPILSFRLNVLSLKIICVLITDILQGHTTIISIAGGPPYFYPGQQPAAFPASPPPSIPHPAAAEEK